MHTKPERGIVTIDGDRYGLTVPSITMVQEIIKCGDTPLLNTILSELPWLKKKHSLFQIKSEVSIFEDRKTQCNWQISTDRTGLLFEGKITLPCESSSEIRQCLPEINGDMFGVVPVLVPLDRNDQPYDICQYQDGEVVIFAGWSLNGKNVQTGVRRNMYSFPNKKLSTADKVAITDTPGSPFLQLRWISWNGLLVAFDTIFEAVPNVAIETGFLGDFVLPTYGKKMGSNHPKY